MRYLTLAVVLACVAGCQSLTEPMPTGPGTYLIAGRDRGDATLPTAMRLEAIQRANYFCAQQGRRFVLLPEPAAPGVAFGCG